MSDVQQSALLSIRHLDVSYRTRSGTAIAAVRDVSLDVGPGEVVAIVGESGSGKSTTAHAVVGLLAANAAIDRGVIDFNGLDLARLSERQLRNVRGGEIGFIPQDPSVSLNPVVPVGDQVAEVLRIHGGLGRRAARLGAIDALAAVGIPEPRERAAQRPHELSGGLRQRVLIAIALVARPKLVVADEPTSALDVTVQRRILDSLAALTSERHTAVLLITHDLGVAADRADRVAVMSEGRLVESGSARDILGAPKHEYTRRLMASAPSLATAAPRRERLPRYDNGHDPVVVAEDLVKDFPRRGQGRRALPLRAVDHVSFAIEPGETFALVGESGSGKSTTARLVMRLTEPTSGRLRVAGRDVLRLRGEELRRTRRQMQLVYQNPFASLDPRFSVGDIIDEPMRAFAVGDKAQRQSRVRELLERVALPSAIAERRPAELSGGQRQRVAIARALAISPSLLICDEPVSALDVSVQAQVLELLVTLQEDLGLAYLFISHDLAVVAQIAHRVGVMQNGRLVETGPTANILAHPEHPYTQELLAAVPGARART